MRNSEIASGGQEGASGVPGERTQRQVAQGPTAVNLFSRSGQDGLVPTINPLGVNSGMTEPPRSIAEARKDREQEDKPALARAMAKRMLGERQLDLQGVYGVEPSAVDLHDLGVERSRALIALETLDFYDDLYSIREIADVSITEDDLRERSEFGHLDDADLSTQAEIMRREVGLRLAEMPRDIRGPEIDIYRRLRIKADEILEDNPDRQVAEVFTDDGLYTQAFTGLYANVEEFVVEQQRFITDKDYLGLLTGIRSREPNLEIGDLDKTAAFYELADRVMIVALARRMWGDDAYEALSPDIRSQLPNLPLKRNTFKKPIVEF